MSLVTYDDSLVLPPFGLQNSGAICYFNSMLQCFLSCTSVIRAFDKLELRTRNPLCAAVWRAIDRASRGQADSGASIEIWHAFRQQLKQCGIATTIGNGMEDAHEGFVKFLEAFGSNELERLFEHRYKTTVQCSRCGDSRNLRDDRGRIQIDTRVFGKFVLADFQLDVPVSQLLLQRDDHTDVDYRCSQCGVKNAHKKIERLVFVPEVVIMLFEKWQHSPGARRAIYNRWAADAPDTFTIPGRHGKVISYRRVAMSEHGGDTDGGHYWAHACRTGGVYRLDDTRVTGPVVAPSTVSTYMAWYHTV